MPASSAGLNPSQQRPGSRTQPIHAIPAAIRAQLALWHRGVAIGFLGGLTTFSSFGADTIRQLESGHYGLGLANVAANVVLSLAAVAAGMAIMQAID